MLSNTNLSDTAPSKVVFVQSHLYRSNHILSRLALILTSRLRNKKNYEKGCFSVSKVFYMTDEFNEAVKERLNSLSRLAIEAASVTVRLQKFIEIIREVLQARAALLLLPDDWPLAKRAWATGIDELLQEVLQDKGVQNSLQQLLPMSEVFTETGLSQPTCHEISDARGQKQKVAIISLALGPQRLGAIIVAGTGCETLRRENPLLVHLLAEQAALVLLVMKGAQTDRSTQGESYFTEELLAMLSHELRAPVQVILGWANVLQQSATSKETLQHALKTIEYSARVQNNIINDLLAAAACFRQPPHFQTRSIAARTILQQVLSTLLPVAKQKGIVIDAEIRLTKESLLADAARLQQAFWHLLSNAIKFTPCQGHIQLRAHRVGNQVELMVADSGSGIAPEFMPHIFEPFRQESTRTTRKFGGLGLGLAIARYQIEAHGGELVITSAGKNQGTKALVRLPLEVPQASSKSLTVELHTAAYPKDLPHYLSKHLDTLRILVVDNDTASLEIVSTILQNCKAEVQTAHNAQEAIEMFQRWMPDILISNVQPGGADGYELLRHLRDDKGLMQRRLAAIALTGYTRAEDRLKILAAGFHTHLTKPVNPTELIAVVASLATQLKESFSLV